MKFDYKKNPPIGIDFGTTNSAICRYSNSRRLPNTAEVYTLNLTGLNQIHRTLFPSTIGYSLTKKALVSGIEAYAMQYSYPELVEKAIKRSLNKKEFIINGKSFSREELLMSFFKDIYKDPIASEHELVPSAIVVAVPYYFKEYQNRIVLDSLTSSLNTLFPGEIEIIGLIPEPVAAALAHIHENIDSFVSNRTGMVFDMGGGTIDITIFKYDNSDQNLYFEVLSTVGLPSLGGEDFDLSIENYLIDKYKLDSDGLEDRQKSKQLSDLRKNVIRMKEELSFPQMQRSNGSMYSYKENKSKDFNLSIDELNAILSGENSSQRNFYKEVSGLLDQAVSNSRIAKDQLDMIILVGGSTQMKLWQDLLKDKFKNIKDFENNTSETIYHSVAKGASLYAAYLADSKKGTSHLPFKKVYNEVKIITRTSHSLGIVKANNKFSEIIPSNVIVPYAATKTYFPTKYKKDNREMIQLKEVKIYQSNQSLNGEISKSEIGVINFPDIYTHDRDINKNELPIYVKFIAESTTLHIEINVPKGKQDKSDIDIVTSVNYEH